MNSHTPNQRVAEKGRTLAAPRPWVPIPIAFGIGVTAGLALLVGRMLLLGNADPFNDNWPLYLPATSFAAPLACTRLTRRPFASALGLYCGLVGYMLLTGACAYPTTSAIALAVHGLFPACLGAFVCMVLLRQSARSATSASHPTDSFRL
jgi:hypothetical protein